MRKIIVFFIFQFIFCSCDNSVSTKIEIASIIIEPLKWYKGKTAAVSITYDAAWGSYWTTDNAIMNTINEVEARKLKIDLELVTSIYNKSEMEYCIKEMTDLLAPKGVHFFGHGHVHSNHDSMSYEEAFISFQNCFQLMSDWGLKPKVYAYPGSKGYELETQTAVKNAGFLAARGYSPDLSTCFICADSLQEPANWYYLPSIPFAKEYEGYINNNEELIPVLSEAIKKTAWIILMYHNIGIEGGWGWYENVEFIKDLDLFFSNDIWCANMDDVAVYIKEKCNFNYSILRNDIPGSYSIVFSDNLDNSFYDHPLTVKFDIASPVKYNTLLILDTEDNERSFTLKNNSCIIDIIPNEKEYTFEIIQ